MKLFLKSSYTICAEREKISKTKICFIFSVFLISISSAQNSFLKGTVRDGETVLPSATVNVANKQLLTNLSGEFSTMITPGTYTIIITHVGYKKIEQSITLKAGEKNPLQFTMMSDGQLGEVVVLGSRSSIPRSNLNTAVPVDAFSSHSLIQTAQLGTIQMLNYSAPSVNTSRQNWSEPVTLRGLSPDHLLIMINGTRYHGLAEINLGYVRGILGRGAVGNDLNSIPFPAIEKIEILRDGATALYGSDAIAGVLNIELKKSISKTSLYAQTGQYYKGDGQNLLFGINKGISINKKGSLNFSGDFRYQAPTHRGGEYNGTVYNSIPSTATLMQRDSITRLDNKKIQESGFSRKAAVSNDGTIQQYGFGVLINGSYPVNDRTEIGCTGLISFRNSLYPGMYRFPKSTNQVNRMLYPDGFKVAISNDTWNASFIVNVKGLIKNKWHWELNSTLGGNFMFQNNSNTDNASQFVIGANAPTAFYMGVASFKQQTNSIGFTKDLTKKISIVKTFILGFGAEFRLENYEIKQGEQASWQNYDFTHTRQAGAQPAPGFSPDDAVDKSRNITGSYVNLESDITDRFFISSTGRIEYYSDFGKNLTGKIAMRYRFTNRFSLRGSLSNGYHAPSLQQTYTSFIGNTFKNNGGVLSQARSGIFSNKSKETKTFGVRQLEPEKAFNVSAGFIATFSNHINLTADAYWINIKDRIVLSGIFDRSNMDAQRVLANHPEIDNVQFFTNAINTNTRGIDIVLNGKWKIHKAVFHTTVAANFTKTQIYGPIKTTDSLPGTSATTLLNIEEREQIEKGQPGSKIIWSSDLSINKFVFVIRHTRFGSTSYLTRVINPVDTLYESSSPKIITDLSITYKIKTWIAITAGANNIFNIYPDKIKNYRNTNDGISIYSSQSYTFGYNGGYYYTALNFIF